MIKRIITGVVILVLALLIFSYITSPSVKSKVSLEFGKIKDDLKEGFENAELKGKVDNTIEEPIKEKRMKEDIKEEAKDDQLIKDCKDSFKECKSISIKKYGWSISLSETKKFDNKEDAEEFYSTWNSLFGIGQELKLDYPIVLFAYSMKSGEISIKIPSIVICEDGELTESSKMGLGC